MRWTISLATYPMDAVYGASYVFIDRCYVYLDKKGKGIEVVLRGKEPLDDEALEALCGQFANELLHQVLRARLAKRSGKVREMIVGRALFSAEGSGAGFEGELEDDFDDFGDEDDYLDDPLGIAVPWEEKYGDQAAPLDQGEAPAEGEHPAGEKDSHE
ncbi:MAG: His-Xaa-Ser system protein HxsD [Polyangia bacterium]|nr:His-Xaa-Ser system protein HxsD [Polyangia bacterium]